MKRKPRALAREICEATPRLMDDRAGRSMITLCNPTNCSNLKRSTDLRHEGQVENQKQVDPFQEFIGVHVARQTTDLHVDTGSTPTRPAKRMSLNRLGLRQLWRGQDKVQMFTIRLWHPPSSAASLLSFRGCLCVSLQHVS